MTTRLVSEGKAEGKIIVVQRDDPLYHTFLSSLEEATGTIPEEIVIPPYVMEQFPAWRTVERWIAIGHGLFYNGELEWEKRGSALLRRNLPPLIYLADVSYLVRALLDPPYGWERFVAVDERSSQEERRHHYTTVGRLTRANKHLELHGIPGDSNLYDDFGMLRDPVRLTQAPGPLYDAQMTEALLAVDEYNILQGIRHDALLKVIARGEATAITRRGNSGNPDWLLVNWMDVVIFACFNWYSLSAKCPTSLLNVHRFLPPACWAYGGIMLPPYIIPIPIQPQVVLTNGPRVPGYIRYHSSCSEVCLPNYNVLYDRTLSALLLPEGDALRSHSNGVGLGPILEEDDTHPFIGTSGEPGYYETGVYTLFSIINFNVLMAVPRRLGKTRLEEDHFEEAIALIVVTLGTRALATFVSTLLHWTGTDPRVLLFCEQAIEVLETLGTDGTFISLTALR